MTRSKAGASKDPLLGRVIDGRYTVLHLLGKGGMGSVYKAHQASLDRAVALKVLLGAPEEARRVEFQKRFFLEASTVARLKHPNTITVFDYGSEDLDGHRMFFIAMELLEGRTLTQALKAGPLPLAKSVSIALQVCRSLREAHRAGVVHRDLKPGNVMLVPHADEGDSDHEFVKVLDFGLAKTFADEDTELTRAGTFLGSPRYVSPEQVEGKETDQRSDIYALGCVTYRMLSGRVPFDGQAPVEIMLKHLNEPVPPLPEAIPPVLKKLVYACLEKEADDRPASMEEVISRLKLVQASLGERIGFMSLSDDRHSMPPQTVPPHPAGEGSAGSSSSLRAELRALSDSGSRSQSTMGSVPTRPTVHDVDLSDERPMRNVLSQVPQVRTRKNVFLRGVVAGLVVAAAVLVALELGAVEWVRARLGQPPPPVPTGDVSHAPTAIRARKVILHLRSDPPAQLVERQGAAVIDRGITPVQLEWSVGPGEKPRAFELRRQGRPATPVTVEIPVDDGTDPQQLVVDVELAKKR